MLQEKFDRAMRDHQKSFEQSFLDQADKVIPFACRVAEIFQRRGKLFIAGTGTLGAIANLGATLFCHRLALDRPPLPSVSLCQDATLATALASSDRHRDFFSRQLRIMADDGDALLLLSDGGRDEALAEAAEAARQCGCLTAALSRSGGELSADGFDYFFALSGESIARTSEHSLFFCHALVELVEGELFGI